MECEGIVLHNPNFGGEWRLELMPIFVIGSEYRR